MPALQITDAQLGPLRGKVVVVTGASSGIGLATVHKLLAAGASIVAGDLSEPDETLSSNPNFAFLRTDVTVWADLVALFKFAKSRHARIDHVFANAGIAHQTGDSYVDDSDVDADGDPVEPKHPILQVNLIGAMHTTRLAVHHFKRQTPQTGSIVITGSGSSYGRFGLSDYAASKHGVLGFMRSLFQQVGRSGLPIRVNLVAPAFTDTAIIEADKVLGWGFAVQPAEIVARSVGYLMADESCDQQTIASEDSRFWEIEAELLQAARDATGGGIKRTAEGSARGGGFIEMPNRIDASSSASQT